MKLSAAERKQGKLNKKHLASALQTLRTDGYVVLENAVPKTLVEETRTKCNIVLQSHIDANPQILVPDKQNHGIFGMHPPREMPFMDPLFTANPFALPILIERLRFASMWTVR